jgi:hypothetical protein
MRLLEIKSKYPLSKCGITAIQFVWVAINNVVAVMGYFTVIAMIYPLKSFDRKRYDDWERWVFFIQFKFCASWGFENNWRIFQSGDVSY